MKSCGLAVQAAVLLVKSCTSQSIWGFGIGQRDKEWVFPQRGMCNCIHRIETLSVRAQPWDRRGLLPNSQWAATKKKNNQKNTLSHIAAPYREEQLKTKPDKPLICFELFESKHWFGTSNTGTTTVMNGPQSSRQPPSSSVQTSPTFHRPMHFVQPISAFWFESSTVQSDRTITNHQL